MDILIYTIGFLCAFILGAYIRKPFVLFVKKEKVSSEFEPVNSVEEDALMRDYEKILRYTENNARGVMND